MAKKKTTKKKEKIEKKDTVKPESLKDKVKNIETDNVKKMARIDDNKRREIVLDQEKGKRISLPYVILIVVVIGIIGAIILASTIPVMNAATIKEGDVVQMQYTGTLEDGTVFDSGEFTFTVGAGEAIDGVDEAVTGMHEGENKYVTLEPEKAYGYHDENMVLEVPRIQEINKIETTTSDIFEESFGVPPVVGELYKVDGMEWSLKVVGITNETVSLEHMVESGKTIDMTDGVGIVYGTSVVTVEGDTIMVLSTPIVGSTVSIYGVGQGEITGMSQTDMTMDFNHKFAGKTLNFDITILSFISS
ncbi:MAG: FKBP-type peptidyl-prolyl cis-trans isomerase [Candidatus Aenigmarchaeota archaeon]|nr:FKBP-type peptidyl-prolyl cis-trans isomerase [Candidatus Aenigmarchaeota archaeon]